MRSRSCILNCQAIFPREAEMTRTTQEVPEPTQKLLRVLALRELRRTSSIGTFELGLFEWYSKETESLLETMLREEQQYIQEQIDSGQQDPNDSGIVAAEYYAKRIRYSHVIYMASLLETFLRAECDRLTTAVGEHNVPFKLAELKGDQWSKKRLFLERIGHFKVRPDLWDDVGDLVLLRNILVHENGAGGRLGAKAARRLSKCPGIVLDGPEVLIESAYIWHAFVAINRLCREIEILVGHAIERAIQAVTVE
jgi:hypothetical protein